jgi:hypothetical protein
MNLRLPTVLAAAVLACFAARAQSEDGTAAALARCAAIADASARLQCYDQLSSGVKPSPATTAQPVAPPQPSPFTPVGTTQAPAAPSPPVGTVQQPAAPSPAVGTAQQPAAPPPAVGAALPQNQTTPQQFGSEQLPSQPTSGGESAPQELDSITAKVASFSYGIFGGFTVVLDNGQVWRELPGDTSRVRFSKSSKDEVTISRGVFGSYNLVVAGENGLYKVQRLK